MAGSMSLWKGDTRDKVMSNMSYNGAPRDSSEWVIRKNESRIT